MSDVLTAVAEVILTPIVEIILAAVTAVLKATGFMTLWTLWPAEKISDTAAVVTGLIIWALGLAGFVTVLLTVPWRG